MVDVYRNSYLQLMERSYDPETVSEHLVHDNPNHQRVARPLFKADIEIAAMAARIGYHCERKPPYQHPDHILTLHLQGKLSVILGDKTHEMKPGDLAYCPPGVPFRRFGEKDDLSCWIYFRIADTELWEPLKQEGPYVRPYDSADLVMILLRRILDADPLLDPDCIHTVLGDANTLVKLLRRLRLHGPVAKGPHGVALRKLLGDIAQAPAEKWTATRMADELNVCPRTLLRVFHQELKQPPRDAVIKIRMKCAAQLLSRTSDKLSRIADKVGYDSVYSFSRLFSKHMGMAPGRYREMVSRREQQ